MVSTTLIDYGVIDSAGETLIDFDVIDSAGETRTVSLLEGTTFDESVESLLEQAEMRRVDQHGNPLSYRFQNLTRGGNEVLPEDRVGVDIGPKDNLQAVPEAIAG